MIEKDEKQIKEFCKKHEINPDNYNKAKEIDMACGRNIDDYIDKIIQHYEVRSKNCESITRQVLTDEILSDKDLKNIHSARYRMKSLSSLIGKIIKKKSSLSETPSDDYDLEKYRDLDENNYDKIITDISGIRILTRYKLQLKDIHNWIWGKYFLGEDYYVKNFVKDYTANPVKAFIAERPKAYYRDDNDWDFYKRFGDDIFEFKKSDKGYNSIHYLINTDGKYIEIQIRTVWDEAWSECTHDVVYKGKNAKLRHELERLSQCLAQQTISAESIATLMYQKANGDMTPKRKQGKKNAATDLKAKKSIHDADIRERINLLNQEVSTEFDGNIDSLF